VQDNIHTQPCTSPIFRNPRPCTPLHSKRKREKREGNKGQVHPAKEPNIFAVNKKSFFCHGYCRGSNRLKSCTMSLRVLVDFVLSVYTECLGHSSEDTVTLPFWLLTSLVQHGYDSLLDLNSTDFCVSATTRKQMNM